MIKRQKSNSQARASHMEEPWGEHHIPFDTVLQWKIGSLRLYCSRVKDELRVSSDQEPSGDPAEVPPDPESLEWTRWAVGEGQDRIRLVPVFPDRSIVARPRVPFYLSQGSQARIYVRVPLWVRIELLSMSDVVLTEIPSMILSNTWFGEFTEGELCYWLSTSARREIHEEDFQSHLAICPLQIRNESQVELHIEKLCLRVAHFSLFQFRGHWWSDEMGIFFESVEKGSRVEMSGRPPADAPESILYTLPRVPQAKRFAARTFAALKALPGLGMIIE